MGKGKDSTNRILDDEVYHITAPSLDAPSKPLSVGAADALELEKLKLEREMLAIERDRIESERNALERDRAAGGSNPNALQVGLGVLALAAGLALVVGAVLGYRAGYDDAHIATPRPRKVLVSTRFLNLLEGTMPQRKGEQAKKKLNMLAVYSRPKEAENVGYFYIVK